MTSFVIGVWVVMMVWLAAGFVVFQLVIQRALREKGVSRPSGFRGPAFVSSQSANLHTYRVRRLRAGQGLAWWRFMIAWRVAFALLAVVAIVLTVLAAIEVG